MQEFVRKPLEQELALVTDRSSDFYKLKEYLRPLVQRAIRRFEHDEESVALQSEEILSQVPLAVHRFLSHGRHKEKTLFSVYFTWYIAEHFRRKEKSESTDTPDLHEQPDHPNDRS